MLRIIITKAISLDYYNLVLHIYSQEETGKTVTGSSKILCYLTQFSTVHIAVYHFKQKRAKRVESHQ